MKKKTKTTAKKTKRAPARAKTRKSAKPNKALAAKAKGKAVKAKRKPVKAKAAAKPAKAKSKAVKVKGKPVQAKSKPGQSANIGAPEAVLGALVATVVADGVLASEERSIVERFAKQPYFASVGDKKAVIQRAMDSITKHGFDGVLTEAAGVLRKQTDREMAFTVCFAATVSDGDVDNDELQVLDLLRKTFKITPERAHELVG